MQPIFRLHQDCLFGPQHYEHKLRKEYYDTRLVKGTSEQLDLINYLTNDFLDIGKPHEWFYEDWRFPGHATGEEEPLSTAFWDFIAKLKNTELKRVYPNGPTRRIPISLPKRYLGQPFGRFPMTFHLSKLDDI